MEKNKKISDACETNENIEKAIARMTSMEPYHCSPFDNPSELKKKAGNLLKKLESLADEGMDKKEKIMTELFGTYNKLAFP